MDMSTTHATAAETPGASTRGSGESAITHSPGSMTCHASRCEVSAAASEGPSMHTHVLMEWMR